MTASLFDLLSRDAGVKADCLAAALGLSDSAMRRLLVDEIGKGRVRRQYIRVEPRGRSYLYFLSDPPAAFPYIRCTQYLAAHPSGTRPEQCRRLFA